MIQSAIDNEHEKERIEEEEEVESLEQVVIKCQILDDEDFTSENLLAQLCNNKFNNTLTSSNDTSVDTATTTTSSSLIMPLIAVSEVTTSPIDLASLDFTNSQIFDNDSTTTAIDIRIEPTTPPPSSLITSSSTEIQLIDNNETNNDILLSNALSIDTSDNFLKNIDSITNTTATNSTTSTNDTCSGDIFLNIEHNNDNDNEFLSNNYNPYNNQVNDFNELLCDRTFNNFESELLQAHNFNRLPYNLLNDDANLLHDQNSSFTLLRPNNLINENGYLNISNTKHDVSIGTDLSISRDLRYLNSVDHLKFKKPSEKESFKLIEKVPQKKSRTKYSKDQIEVLENAYSRNPYPDVITVEQLCKTLDISREKVNIWFQNRRARTKRNNKIMNDNSSINNSNNNRTNGYTKFFQTFQQAQQAQIVYNVPNINAPYYTQQNFIQRPATVVQTNTNYPLYTTNTNSTTNSNAYINSNDSTNSNTNNNFCLTTTSFDYTAGV